MRDQNMHRSGWTGTEAGPPLLVLAALLMLPGPVLGQSPDGVEERPTFSEDVAPILYESCVRCHHADGIGPMSLLEYESAKRYAPLIKHRVQNRTMPPWHLDATYGIQEYKNDISLSESEIETLARWADAGAPEGDPSSVPPAPALPTDGWELEEQLGPPDFVVRSTPYTVKPNAQDQWWTPTTEFSGHIDEPRYVRAMELKGSYPLGRKVLHHGHATLVMDAGDGETVGRPLGRQGVGKGGDVFREDTGMLIQPEGSVRWNLHYFPIDVPVEDEQAQAAVWLYPKGYQPELTTSGEERFLADRGGDMRWAGDIVIPPHSVKIQQGFHVLDRPAMINSFRPHMHARGREQSLEVILPDGTRKSLSKVDRYNHFWQIGYEYEDDVKPLLPQGTVMVLTTTFDNTANNPINPDPDQWVLFGQRGVDEMSHAWIGITHLTQAQYDRLLAERRDAQGRTAEDD